MWKIIIQLLCRVVLELRHRHRGHTGPVKIAFCLSLVNQINFELTPLGIWLCHLITLRSGFSLRVCVCARPNHRSNHTHKHANAHTLSHINRIKSPASFYTHQRPRIELGNPKERPERERERGKGRVECFFVLFTTFHVIFEVIFLIFFPTRASVDNRNAWQRFTTHACQTAHSIPVQILELQLGKCVGIGIY